MISSLQPEDTCRHRVEVWNWLDFIVVLTAWASFVPGGAADGSGRLTRSIARQVGLLPSLPCAPSIAVSQCSAADEGRGHLHKFEKTQVLVNTVISSVPKLGNVSAVGAFLFLVFGIIGEPFEGFA